MEHSEFSLQEISHNILFSNKIIMVYKVLVYLNFI